MRKESYKGKCLDHKLCNDAKCFVIRNEYEGEKTLMS